MRPEGHAIECRINAEDPETFMPSPGKIQTFHSPGGPGIRMDTHIYNGYTVPPYYDSMIGKLIAHGETRAAAVARMRTALEEMVIDGIKTNIPLHKWLLWDPGFLRGGFNIHYLEKRLEEIKETDEDADPFIEISVSDTGIGIDPVQLSPQHFEVGSQPISMTALLIKTCLQPEDERVIFDGKCAVLSLCQAIKRE